MKPYVNINIENEVGYIEFYHPDHNAMPTENLQKLTQTIQDAGNNDAIKVLVIKSGGDRTFCAGASFKELISINNEAAGKQFFLGFANLMNTMRQCPKFIIGRVQGKAIGGGVGLAAATDYCLATKFASIKLSELSIGIGPFVIEPVVTRKMGLAAMSQMTLDAETFYNADFAKENKLYNSIYDTTEALDEAVKSIAEKLSCYNPEALKAMKSVIWEGTDHWDSLLTDRAEISGKLVLSDFTKETLKRFK